MPDNVQNIVGEEVMKMFRSLLSQNNEIKGELKLIRDQISSQDNLLLEIRRENTLLKDKAIILEKRVKTLERQVRQNNIVIYNIEETEDVPLANKVKDFLNRTLNVELDDREIDAIYRIGKRADNINQKRPILLKLVSQLKKREILSDQAVERERCRCV